LYKFSPAEINYEVYDKELFAVVHSFKLSQIYLVGTLLPVLVYTDHQYLESFTTTKVLNKLHARSAQELADIDFIICYYPDSQNGNLDVLSQCSEYCTATGGSEEQLIQTVLQDKHFEDKLLNTNTEEVIITAMKLPSKRWINWIKEFLEEVLKEGVKDEDYLEA
jgi:hypothetical protein